MALKSCRDAYVGADFLAALEASCLRGALPPVDLRAVCLVRAIGFYVLSDKKRDSRAVDLGVSAMWLLGMFIPGVGCGGDQQNKQNNNKSQTPETAKNFKLFLLLLPRTRKLIYVCGPVKY